MGVADSNVTLDVSADAVTNPVAVVTVDACATANPVLVAVSVALLTC